MFRNDAQEVDVFGGMGEELVLLSQKLQFVVEIFQGRLTAYGVRPVAGQVRGRAPQCGRADPPG